MELDRVPGFLFLSILMRKDSWVWSEVWGAGKIPWNGASVRDMLGLENGEREEEPASAI